MKETFFLAAAMAELENNERMFKVYQRLHDLENMDDVDRGGGDPLSVDSAEHFVTYMLEQGHPKPAIGMNDAGEIVAAWRADRTIWFKVDGRVTCTSPTGSTYQTTIEELIKHERLCQEG